jgi:hypothetical protein
MLMPYLLQLFGSGQGGAGGLASLFGTGTASAGVGGNALLGGQNTQGNALTGSPSVVGGMQPVAGNTQAPSGVTGGATNMLTQLFSSMPQSTISSAPSPLSNNIGLV